MGAAALAVSALLGLGPLQGGPLITGRVLDAQTGEPVVGAAVVIDGRPAAAAASDGAFAVAAGPPRRVDVLVTAVGYAFVTRRVDVTDAGTDLGAIRLNRESAGATERVDVRSAAVDAMPTRTLTKVDLQTLSMVVVDDPLRSVHALPGVAANNDLKTEFSLRGAGFEQVGVYVDGVRTAGFVHLLSDSGTTDQLSLSVVNQDTLASAALTPGVNDARAGGVTAGALALDTREGNRDRLTVHLSTGFVVSSGVLEGPLPRKRGSWLLAGRTTRFDYVQRAVDRVAGTGDDGSGDDDGSDLEFGDLIGKAVFDASARHQITASWLAGAFTNDERGGAGAKSSNRLGSLAWQAVVNARLFTRVQGFVLSTAYGEHDADRQRTVDDGQRSAGLRADVVVQVSSAHQLQVGLYAQAVRAHAGGPERLGAFAARRSEPSWYVQDRWTPSARVSVTAGVRVDRAAGETVAAPRMLVAGVARGWTLRASAGTQYQLPPLAAVHGLLGNPALRMSQAYEIDGGFEREVRGGLTLSVDLYRRRDRDGLFALAEPRLEDGRITARLNPFQNALDGTARGLEVAVRRGSARRFSGWVGYAYGDARVIDGFDGLAFPSDADQRHTLNAVGTLRLSATLALAAQWRYGSGMPRPGFLRPAGTTLVIGPDRNQVRLAPYDRLDLRIRKVFLPAWGMFTVSGEVLNVLNRKNEYTVESTIVSLARTGVYASGLRRGFGVVPSLGLSVQF
jgi:TonB dependent receptor-like, beta-barrel/Carboxypeptidase regulatory-like domain